MAPVIKLKAGKDAQILLFRNLIALEIKILFSRR